MTQAAYQINGQIVSREAFYAAACNPARPVVVEACAGAGKTWMLVSRMLRALLAQGDDLKPDEILAITFTKDAAAEMRERLYQWLEDFAKADDAQLGQELLSRGVVSQTGRQPADSLRKQLSNLYQRLLASGRDVQIKTFHGWFASLLKVAPIAVLQQLQLPAVYELIEDDAQAIAHVWRRFFATLLADSDAARALKADYQAVVAEHGAFNTQKALRSALDKRVEFDRADATGAVALSVKRFDEMFTEFAGLDRPEELLSTNRDHRQKLRDAARVLGASSAKTFSEKGVELEKALEAQDIAAMQAALLTQKGEPRKFGKLQDNPIVNAAQDLVLRVAAAQAQHAAWQHQQRMARLTRVLIADYADLKRERGWVDMSDLERGAVLLLADPGLSGWVQERLDAQVKHLLIDEFQDTNPLQWQALFAWLQSYAGAGNAAPSVFIVGDPKQSIYRFRRAEPQVFEAAKSFVREGLRGDVLACDHTRRNALGVISVVNAVMGAAQEADELGHAADGGAVFRSHTTESKDQGRCVLLAQLPRPPKDKKEVSLDWRDSLTTPRDEPEEKLPELEAAQAAAWLAQSIVHFEIEPGEVMVLARKRSRLAQMHEALRALGLASWYSEKSSLFDAPEVQDMTALVDALVSPANDLALAQALKSPLFAVDDESLVQIALQAKSSHLKWFDLLQKEELSAQLNSRLPADLASKLRQYRHWLHTLPPHDALDAIYHHANAMERFAAAAPAPLRKAVQANLQALLASALDVEGARYLSAYQWVRAIKSGSVKAQPITQPKAVQLLTVHGAKGLEAKLVLMLDTDAAPPKAEFMSTLIQWQAQDSAPTRFVFLPSETSPPQCCADLLAHERAAKAREELNALYVAMTRAKNTLVVSSHEPHQHDEGSPYKRLQTAAAVGAAPIEVLMEPVESTHAHANAPEQALANFSIQKLPSAGVFIAQAAIKTVATADQSGDSSRLGQAMHRLLERASREEIATRRFTLASQRAIAREFSLSAGQSTQAADMAQQILTGQAAWAWDDSVIDWAGNEVELMFDGELLRIDRLVRRKDTGAWWVLDYKSAAAPERDASLQTQLAAYKSAVAGANEGALVHSAFLTAAGRLVLADA
jgi:ATP-dependent helicase/nuclease subunit A